MAQGSSLKALEAQKGREAAQRRRAPAAVARARASRRGRGGPQRFASHLPRPRAGGAAMALPGGGALEVVRATALSDAEFAQVVELEQRSYPADEAAAPETMAWRRRAAPDLFLVAVERPAPPAPPQEDHAQGQGGLRAESARRVAAFVNGTLALGRALEHETMSSHEEGGSTLCIHSVVCAPGLRRQGLASALLRRYLEEVASSRPRVERALLLSKASLMRLYEAAGFLNRGPSKVAHGREQWYELSLELRRTPLCVVNAFAAPARRFSGNPAAVCLVPSGLRSLGGCGRPRGPPPLLAPDEAEARTEAWMRCVAAQMNLSETAFLRYLGPGTAPGQCRLELRWLTPTVEVELCGHATLASACALWDPGSGLTLPGAAVAEAHELVFETRSGELFARRRALPGGRFEVALDFPLERSWAAPEPLAARVLRALRLPAELVVAVAQNRLDVLVEVAHSDALLALAPDMAALAAVETRGVSVTARAVEGSVDFVTRFFGPRVGIDEDPVTGSALCYLVRLGAVGVLCLCLCWLGLPWLAPRAISLTGTREPHRAHGGRRSCKSHRCGSYRPASARATPQCWSTPRRAGSSSQAWASSRGAARFFRHPSRTRASSVGLKREARASSVDMRRGRRALVSSVKHQASVSSVERRA